MIEVIVEGGGIVVGLGLLLYFQVIRPDPVLVRAKDKARLKGSALDPRGPPAPDPGDVK